MPTLPVPGLELLIGDTEGGDGDGIGLEEEAGGVELGAGGVLLVGRIDEERERALQRLVDRFFLRGSENSRAFLAMAW